MLFTSVTDVTNTLMMRGHGGQCFNLLESKLHDMQQQV